MFGSTGIELFVAELPEKKGLFISGGVFELNPIRTEAVVACVEVNPQ
jgi:hypothetical protein